MEFHDVTGQQKGALGEALFSVSHGTKSVLASWIYNDLHQHERLSPTSADDISIHRCGRRQCEYHHCDPFEEKPGWFPDFHFYAVPDDGERAGHTKTRFEYLLEIKTGSSSTLSANQREVMEYIERTESKTVPVRTRVDVSDLPRKYGVKFTRIHNRW
jgi:hypothetical protein